LKVTELLVATSNSGKLVEIRALLEDLPLTLHGLAEFPTIDVVAETGSTFAENAALKASGYARQAGMHALADDSGLAVDALHGGPGVHSARYLAEDASYHDRIAALLAELRDVAGLARTARFVCAVAIASPDGTIIKRTEATCEGRITDAPRGNGGFGYDPVFVPLDFNLTFGELPADLKNRISHRGKALVAAREFLASLTATSTAR
jgi:XTP/dITP diphosphohydrolase